MDKELLNKIVIKYNLGKLKTEPTRVYGGLLHVSYKLQTTSGTFLVKLFGKISNIKLSMQDFLEQEKFEDLYYKNKIPAIYALKFNGHGIQLLDDEVFCLFKWFNGKVIKGVNSTINQCKKMAKVTAKTHNIKLINDGKNEELININWKSLLSKAKKQNSIVTNLLSENLKMLEDLTIKANEFIPKLPNVKAICHNDMDCKNVMWKGLKYRLIDLECIGLHNPYLEAFINALNWSGYAECDINFKKYNVFLKTYFKHSKLSKDINFEVLYYGSALGLEWLEFSIKRALKLVGNSNEEQQLGIEQTKLTINQIKHFYEHKNEIINI